MIADSYADAAISGSSMILRPAVQKLLADAQAGKFDIVVAEALDRVSRDQADVATLYKHLQFARVPLITLAEGEISELERKSGGEGQSVSVRLDLGCRLSLKKKKKQK